jgi:hypothetical protein
MILTADENSKFPFYKVGSIASFGFLKRADLGTAWNDVWEAPTGELFTVKRGFMPEIAIFTSPPGSQVTSNI